MSAEGKRLFRYELRYGLLRYIYIVGLMTIGLSLWFEILLAQRSNLYLILWGIMVCEAVVAGMTNWNWQYSICLSMGSKRRNLMIITIGRMLLSAASAAVFVTLIGKLIYASYFEGILGKSVFVIFMEMLILSTLANISGILMLYKKIAGYALMVVFISVSGALMFAGGISDAGDKVMEYIRYMMCGISIPVLTGVAVLICTIGLFAIYKQLMRYTVR